MVFVRSWRSQAFTAAPSRLGRLTILGSVKLVSIFFPNPPFSNLSVATRTSSQVRKKILYSVGLYFRR
jgi:hypothetical protein